MSCTKRFLFLTWTHHDWHRAVSWAEQHDARETDMWGRGTTQEFVTCQTQYFCRKCGATKGVRFCGCDKSKADQCAVRLSYLASTETRT